MTDESLHRIIVTRRLDQADVDYAHSLGLYAVCIPMLRIRFPEKWDRERRELKDYNADAWAFTSMNGVRALGMIEPQKYGIPNPKSVFAVGNKTAEPLSEAGFNVMVPDTERNASGLADLILEQPGIRNVVHFAGSRHRSELQEKLTRAGVPLLELIVYNTETKPVRVDSSKAEAILFYSPTGVEAYAEENDLTNRPCFAIGPTTATALRENGAQEVIQSDVPDTHTMLEKVHHYLEKNGRIFTIDKK